MGKQTDYKVDPVNLLRSSWAVMITLSFMLYAQIPHTEYVFEHLVEEGPDGRLFAIGFESAILMLVVRQMHRWSWLFAGLSVLVNVSYYGLNGFEMYAHPLENWARWLFSILIPLGIATYSHILDMRENGAISFDVMRWASQLWRRWTEDEPIESDAEMDTETSDVDVEAVSQPSQPAPKKRPPRKATKRVSTNNKDVAHRMIRDGKANGEIAEHLNVSPSTVATWRSRLKEPAATNGTSG